MNALGQETGGNAESRHTEGLYLLEIIKTGDEGSLTDWERRFIEEMEIRYKENPEFIPSGKQIFVLRNIRDKTL